MNIVVNLTFTVSYPSLPVVLNCARTNKTGMAFKENQIHQRLLMRAAARPEAVLSLKPSVITSTLLRITAKQDAASTYRLKVYIKTIFSGTPSSIARFIIYSSYSGV